MPQTFGHYIERLIEIPGEILGDEGRIKLFPLESLEN